MQALDVERVRSFFASEGKLANNFNNYEYRPQQQDMAVKITKVFNNNHHLLVEAGTGTGKSFAYLLPSILFALENEEQVVISTNTINLQEQLINKDIPALIEILGLDCKAVLAKGRRNYLCLRRLNYYQKSSRMKEEEYETLTQINKWALDTVSGSRSDLDFQVSAKLWRHICAESRSCLGYRCPFYEQCFFMLARKELEEADILVVNHHLLFADISLRQTGDFKDQVAVLPPYDRVIFDEAHNLEEIATSYLGIRVSSQELIDTLELLYNSSETEGVLLQLRIESKVLSDRLRKRIQTKIDNKLVPLVTNLLDKIKASKEKVKSFIKDRKLRLTEEVRDDKYWQEVAAVEFENLLIDLKSLCQKLADLLTALSEREREVIELEELEAIVESRFRVINSTVEILTEIIGSPRENTVYWLEDLYDGYSLHSAPLDIADKLEKNLLEELKSAVFTSATLTVDNSFKFMKENLGLTGEEVDGLKVGSPFNYSQQLKVGIIKDISSPDEDDFIDGVVKSVKKIIKVNQGRSLLLFTSYRRLNQVYDRLSVKLDKLEVDHLFCQGKKPRQKLIKEFKSAEKAVLLGTNSFWEGIDIPGDKLSCLVIVKLPFLVPSEPVTEAKLELISEEGGNSFFDYMLPKAVIRFRQGCGRLIRTKYDKGWLFVLDNRVLTKSYGRLFLNSIRGRILINRVNSLVERIKKDF